MKTVIVIPERCVGCQQCQVACAVEHSQSKNLFAALSEAVQPRPRLRVYPGASHFAFVNKCRHCDPAPCQMVCMPGAITHNPELGTTDIDPHRCISCAMCAMACPFGVLRFAPSVEALEKGPVALKCDQCPDRVREGRVPACVEACKVGALRYGTLAEAMELKGLRVSRSVFATLQGTESITTAVPEQVRLWRQLS
ncbi:MAG: 4Fe-4S ferredoxin [Deltaproteobacteria bacterium]|nr:4Fe-4S ferredoxin [Deltaproteobacteria bacterium]